MKNKKLLKYFAGMAVAIMLVSGTQVIFAQTTTSATDGAGPTSSAKAAVVDIENLKAIPGDSVVFLSWDAAPSDSGVVGYKIYRGTQSVTSGEDTYNLPAIPVENATQYTVKNLTNGTTYYFSATAMDKNNNESAKFAVEVSATPQVGLKTSAEDDGKSPNIKEVKLEDVISVKVIFSEPVKLPDEQPESAFTIEKTADKSRLEVQKAEIDARDSSGATVLLTTAPQEEKADYSLTAGIEVEDLYGNPVVSGTSDTGYFTGVAGKKQEAKTDIPKAGEEITIPEHGALAPTVSSGDSDGQNRITVNFSEPIVLPSNAASKFEVFEKGTTNKLHVSDISLSVDGKTAFLTTDKQKGVEYEVKVLSVKDAAGNEVLAASSATIEPKRASGVEDLVPPEEVTKLVARIKNAKKNLVELSWKASKNSAGDLGDQLLYQSPDHEGKKFGKATSLGTSTTVVEVEDLEANSWHTFKVTTQDTSSNESTGAFVSIFLPETGPEVAVIAAFALTTAWHRRRKKVLEVKGDR